MRTGDQGVRRGVSRSTADVIARKDAAATGPDLVLTLHVPRAASRSIENMLIRELFARCSVEFDGNSVGAIFADVLVHASEDRALLATWEIVGPRAPL
jgi:hypothetical protein